MVEGLSEPLMEAVASSAGAVYSVVPEVSLRSHEQGAVADHCRVQNLRAPVLAVYARTLDDVFIIGVPFGLIAVLAAVFLIERKRYETKKAPRKAAEKAAEEGEAGAESVKSQKA